MHQRLQILITTAIFCIAVPPTNAQEKQELTVGLYTPNGPIVGTSKRHAYIRKLASSIQKQTGINTTGKAFIRYGDLIKERVDFAIIDGLCVTAMRPGNVLATMSIQGKKRSAWSLFARTGQSVLDLKNKRIAYVNTGCRNIAFIFNGMLKGEIQPSYFSKTIAKPSIDGAIASVQGFKIADAVFAPSSYSKGLVQVFQAGYVTNPAFLQLNSKISPTIRANVLSALKSFHSDQLNWVSPLLYKSYSSLFNVRAKTPLFIIPHRIKLDLKALINRPKFKFQSTSVMHLLQSPK